MEQLSCRILVVDAKGGESQKSAALETGSIRQPERAAEGSRIHGARPARDPNGTGRGSWRRCSAGLDQGNAGRVDQPQNRPQGPGTSGEIETGNTTRGTGRRPYIGA